MTAADLSTVAAPLPGRIRRRPLPCGRPGCPSCPHGSYYALRWRDTDGHWRERYLGRDATLPACLTPEEPRPRRGRRRVKPGLGLPAAGTLVLAAAAARWGAAPQEHVLAAPRLWTSCVSAFRVEATGLSRNGHDGNGPDYVAWAALRTLDGRAVYRVEPDVTEGFTASPSDPARRWPLGDLRVLLT